MQRRDVLRLTGAGTALSVPHIARAQRAKTLRFVPIIPLTLLDPTTVGIPSTRSHGACRRCQHGQEW
jgi:hypothetical protein